MKRQTARNTSPLNVESLLVAQAPTRISRVRLCDFAFNLTSSTTSRDRENSDHNACAVSAIELIQHGIPVVSI
jgi:hypothetical protein